MDPQSLLYQNRERVLETAARYGAYNVRVFGSVARGEATANSDIDLLVSMEPGRSLMDLGGLLYELRSMLGVEVDVVTEKGLRARSRDQVIREAGKRSIQMNCFKFGWFVTCRLLERLPAG